MSIKSFIERLIGRKKTFDDACRYDDEYREFTREELDQQDFIDNSIMELINTVNPSQRKIKYDGHIVSKIREPLIEIMTEDLALCKEWEFYP